jgi:hypothetical protein
MPRTHSSPALPAPCAWSAGGSSWSKRRSSSLLSAGTSAGIELSLMLPSDSSPLSDAASGADCITDIKSSPSEPGRACDMRVRVTRTSSCPSCGIQPSSSERVASESGVSATSGCDMEPVVLESESSPTRLPRPFVPKTCACTSSACVMLASSTRAGVSPPAGGGVSLCSAGTVSPRASASDEGRFAAAGVK